jgi:hypothetical protein
MSTELELSNYNTKDAIHAACFQRNVIFVKQHSELIAAFEARAKELRLAEKTNKPAKVASAPKVPSAAQLQAKEKQIEASIKRLTILNSLIRAQNQASDANVAINSISPELLPLMKGVKEIGIKASALNAVRIALAKMEFAGVVILACGKKIHFTETGAKDLILQLSKESGRGLAPKDRKEAGLTSDLAYVRYLAQGCAIVNKAGEKSYVHIGRYTDEQVAFESLTFEQQLAIKELGKPQGFCAEAVSTISSPPAIAPVDISATDFMKDDLFELAA